MALTAFRRVTATGGLALAGLIGFVAPASATQVNIDKFGGSTSQLRIFDNDDNADNVTVSLSGATFSVADTGPGGITPSGTDCTAVNAALVTCPLDPPDNPPPAQPFLPVEAVFFDAEGGADSLTVNAPIRVAADGGEGPDVLNGGALADSMDGGEGIDQLNGFAESDFLSGGPENDTLNGGDGDDQFSDGGENLSTGGVDVLNGGSGRDAAGYFREGPVDISLDDVANDGFAGEGDNLIDIEDVQTGDGADAITGNDEQNELFSGEGNDTIRGLGASDILGGDEGDDVLDGGTAADQVFCDDGIDTALLDVDDFFGVDCERTGATAKLDTATVSGKGVAKIPVSCSPEEAVTCTGKVKLELNGKTIGKGKFKAPVGKTKQAKVKLSKGGKKTLKRNGGSALVTALVETDLAGGTSVTDDSLLLKQKGNGGKKGGGKK